MPTKSATKKGAGKVLKGKKINVELMVKKELPAILSEGSMLVIADEESLTQGTEILSKLNLKLDAIETERKRITEPLNQALKVENGRWKPAKDAISEVIKGLRAKMGEYQTKVVAEQHAVENTQAEKLAAGEINIETAVENASAFKAVDKVKTEAGSLSFKPTPKLKVWDETMIPREYLMIDEGKLFAALQGGKEVPGAAIEIIQVPVNRR